ncbi:MAG: dienelactone hydrolase [Actinobacteria bacterium]|nr:dienelactone hydrolase [Actinomycetota bacterium]
MRAASCAGGDGRGSVVEVATAQVLKRRFGLLLAPGAGSGSDQLGLVAIDRAATAVGFAVRRMDFPYRLAGRRAPDRPEVLLSALSTEATSFAASAGLRPEQVFAGGRSMGGRICSLAVAGGMPAAGLVLVSYPLHPPGRPERPRSEHFCRLHLPCLFVSGTRDAFGTPEELEQALKALPGPVSLHLVQGGDHSLRRRDQEVAEVVSTWLVGQAGAQARR